MTAIIKIEIEGFKAFPQKFELELDEGKNLLLYGETGSGKSSISEIVSKKLGFT